MVSHQDVPRYRSIFTTSTPAERVQNFELYWQFCQEQDGELVEAERALSRKQEILQAFQKHPVRARQPLPDPEAFYRNCVRCQDTLEGMDRRTLLLMAIYKLARHEWVGISRAWEKTPPFHESHHVINKICRYHLAEEFCHIQLFEEMFRTCHLERVVWVPLHPAMVRVSQVFLLMPEVILNALAFVTELMGLMFYQAVGVLLDEVFQDDPEACQRLQELLREITVDELAHIGQRRNFLSARGVTLARWMVWPVFRGFYKEMPESRYLFDVGHMMQQALAFDYNAMAPALLQRSWVPTYCQVGGRVAD